MSTVTNTVNKSNFQQNDYDFSKIFLGENRYASVEFTASGADLELTAGMLIGKISATQKGKVLASASTDGSQFPFGIIPQDITVLDGETKVISVCIAGNVAQEKIVLAGSDTLATPVSLRSIGDRIMSDTLGIKLVKTTENSGFDN